MVKLWWSMVPVLAGALIACAGSDGALEPDVTDADALDADAAEQVTAAVSRRLQDGERPVERAGDGPARRERPSGGGKKGSGHARLCEELQLISNVNSDEASDAYGRGDKKGGREHASVADRAWQDARSHGCGWAA